MKKSIVALMIIFFTVGVSAVKAQTIKIDTTNIGYENKLRPCLGTEIDPAKDQVVKAWSTYLKKVYGVKLKGSGIFSNDLVMKAQDVLMPTVSDRRMNIYTRIIPLASGSEIKFFASYGYDIYIGENNYPNEYSAMHKIFKEFLLGFLSDYYVDEINSTAKMIKDLSKDQMKIAKNIDKNNKKSFKISNQIAVENATEKASNEESVKSAEKVVKLSNQKTSLENENSTARVKSKLIDEQLVNLKLNLETLQFRKNNLVVY